MDPLHRFRRGTGRITPKKRGLRQSVPIGAGLYSNTENVQSAMIETSAVILWLWQCYAPSGAFDTLGCIPYGRLPRRETRFIRNFKAENQRQRQSIKRHKNCQAKKNNIMYNIIISLKRGGSDAESQESKENHRGVQIALQG